MYTLIAHRGASKEAPENTIIAIQKALDIGVDYVEFDVHLTSDLIPVVIHDAILGRTTDNRPLERITDLALAQLRSLDAGHWFGKEYQGQRIPTLDEVLQMERGHTGFMIEVKKGHSPIKPLVTNVVKSISGAPKDKILLGSFSPHILEEIQSQDPHTELIGILEDVNMISTFRSMKLPKLAIWYKLITRPLVDQLHELGTLVWAFTVDERRTADFLISIGVDGIISNDPRLLKKAKR